MIETRTDSAQRHRPDGRRPAWQVFVMAFLVLAALAGSWAVTSPLESAPDEPAHTIHAVAVVRGELTGAPSTLQRGATEVEVPAWAADLRLLTCFRENPSIGANCQRPLTESTSDATGLTSAGTYNPLYYAVVGLPSLALEGKTALYAMRGLSVAWCCALLALAVVALSRLRSPAWPLAAFAVAVTPMVLFILGSVNPSALEISATVMLFCWLTLIADRRPRRLPPSHAVAVAVSGALAANTRSIALLWVLLVVVATLADRTLLRRLVTLRAVWVAAGVVALAAVAGLLWTLQSNSLGPGVPYPGVGTSHLAGFVHMLLLTFENGQGYVGVFGWLDTPLPATPVVIWGGIILALAITALVFGRGRRRWSVVVLAAGVVLVPPVVQGIAVTQSGYIWQSRYLLALVACLVIASGVAIGHAFPRSLENARVRLLYVALLVALGIMQVHASVWALKRYVVSDAFGWRTMLTNPQWQPPLGWPVWVGVLAIGLIAGTLVLVRLAWAPPVPAADEAESGDASAPRSARAEIVDSQAL